QWFFIEYFPIAALAIAWTLFIVQYAGWGDALRPRIICLLLAEPVITAVLMYTNDLHGLIWLTSGVHQEPGYLALDMTFGLWYWVHLGYQYVTYLGGSLALALALAHRRRLYRQQAGSLLLGALVPLIGNAIFSVGIVPVDLAPFSLAVSGVIWWWGLV